MDTKQKQRLYSRIFDQLNADLLPKCEDTEARMSTIVALLHHKMDQYFWTGFYLLINDRLLVRSYQGPAACMELPKDTGVCWAAVNRKQTIVVPDVQQFPGHIACNSLSKSEIATPLEDRGGKIIGVLDVDSRSLTAFDDVDGEWLKKILELIWV